MSQTEEKDTSTDKDLTKKPSRHSPEARRELGRRLIEGAILASREHREDLQDQQDNQNAKE